MVTGKACRLLLDGGAYNVEQVASRLSYATSRAADPMTAALWVEGFLSGSGLVLIHNPGLWKIVDDWVTGLTDDHFTETLPLLRRTFSQFSPAERRQMGERVSKVPAEKTASEVQAPAKPVVNPLLGQMLGIKGKKP
jgi:hypothetical protein